MQVRQDPVSLIKPLNHQRAESSPFLNTSHILLPPSSFILADLNLQTQTRPRDNAARFANRRGHLQQLSISDDHHHVTEAIGYMYGDDDNESRRSSQASSVNPTSPVERRMQDFTEGPRRNSIPRKAAPMERKLSNGHAILGSAASRSPPIRQGSWEGRQNKSPHGRERSPSETANAHFPLNDVDYESSPAAVAQELSNLQALRRMSMISMDGGAAGDPDLPHLNAAALPSAPSSTSSEDDESRLFWVPARLHPELAPKEFKSFLDSKAEQIKRRSGELSQFTSPGTTRSNSASSSLSLNVESGGLRRKKSMLSRQINSSVGYQDGAERLERKRSQGTHGTFTDPNLSTLEALVSGDPSHRLSLETSGGESQEDIILPSVPGASLKRSTRTNYRRGGSVKGGRPDRSTYAQRAARRVATHGDSPVTPSAPEVPQMATLASEDMSNLAQSLKDPSAVSSPALSSSATGPERAGNRQGGVYNFSRPPSLGRPTPTGTQPAEPRAQAVSTFDNILGVPDEHRVSTASMPERTALPLINTGTDRPVPQIVETPAPEDPVRPTTAPSPVQLPVRHPERSSSRESKPFQRPGMPPKQNSSVNAVPTLQQQQQQQQPPPGQRYMSNQQHSHRPQSLDQPSPLPGNNTNTTDLSFIPTLTVDKRADHKTKEEGKKSSWGWLLGKEERERDKSEKPKAKIVKPPQSHDNTRLDVLQTSIEGNKGRESVVLDRDSLRLDEERKKESARKSSGEGKKEKEGLFSSLFGKKGKAEKEATKKYKDRLSPEPTVRELKPDIDYNWTRFSILEERAIYRMAHIKLANPRRALYSQVLLSNFMYSYLAKVQQMHPQMNLPTSAKQQRKQKEQSTTPQQQPDEFTQYQRYQQVRMTELSREPN